jgi:hypothetical protein
MSKIIIFGLSGLLVAAGLTVLAAQLGGSPSDTMRGAGLFLFSFGVMLAALGLYQQARRLKVEYEGAKPRQKKKSDRLCSVCNRERAEVFCRVHVLRLCLSCLGSHDDGKNCLYVPANRASAAYK